MEKSRAKENRQAGPAGKRSANKEKKEIPHLGDLGAYAVGLFYIGMVMYWLHDPSRGKQRTLALLDRSLKLATRVLKKGAWDW